MIPGRFRVVLDADVLFPCLLRDTLLRAAEREFFQIYWSAEILEEVRRNLVATDTTSEQQAQQLVNAMDGAFPEAMVDGYQDLVDAMPNHPKDRHVAAVAVRVGAQLIVTNNLQDFGTLPQDMEAQSPDDFLGNLFDLDPHRFVLLIAEQAGDLRRPPMTMGQLLDGLKKIVPAFVTDVRRNLGGNP